VALGNKVGVVAGQVIDAGSGAATKALLKFSLTTMATAVKSWPMVGVPLPPGKDLILLVMAVSRQSSTQRPFHTPLRLEPGQEIYMDIPVSNQ